MGIIKLRKGNKRSTIILDCDSEEEMHNIKVTLQAKLDKNGKVTKSPSK